jgi:hypothetical protein
MAGKSNLPANPDAASKASGSGHSNLSGKHAVRPYLGPMSDLDKIIYFSAAANNRVSHCCSINCSICADFHIVFNHNSPGLAYFVKSSVFRWSKTESITSYNCAVLENYPIPNRAALAHNYSGMQFRIIADRNMGIQCNMRMNRDSIANSASFFDNRISSNAELRFRQ